MGARLPGGDGRTVQAFLGIVLIGGSNAVAIRLGNSELAPFQGATLRFALAALILLAIVAIRRPPLPHGRARIGIVLYGLTSFAGSYAALYWGLVEAPAAMAMIAIATVPLMTLVMTAAIGQERITGRAIAAAAVALVGTGVIVGDQLSAAVPLIRIASLFIGAGFIAASGVIVKAIPPGHPVPANAFGMAVAAVALAALTAISGQPLAFPSDTVPVLSVLYLATVGSVGLFMLVLYVLARWTASATSYATLLMPLVTIAAASIFLQETVSPRFFLGAALALVGVYLGISQGTRGRLALPSMRRLRP